MRHAYSFPARDARHYLERSLPALLRAVRNDKAVEVFVVDNGSRDGTDALIARFGSAVCLLNAPGVRVGAVRNAGAAVASGELLCFLDADCVVEADFFDWVAQPQMNGALPSPSQFIVFAWKATGTPGNPAPVPGFTGMSRGEQRVVPVCWIVIVTGRTCPKAI